jgi:Flp pilus assembly protein TadG
MLKDRFVRFGWQTFWHSESGSALVETALTFPVLIALLLGAVELGDMASKATQITNAARAAAQYAAMNGGGYADCNNSLTGGSPCSATRGMYKAASYDASAIISKCTSFTVSAANTCSCTSGVACTANAATGTTSAYYSCSSGKVIMAVAVTTTAQCSPVSSVPGLFSGPFSLQGYAKQQVLQ